MPAVSRPTPRPLPPGAAAVVPRIVGPASWPACAAPPQFRVDAAGLPLWMVEMATSRALMESIEDRSGDNYYFGGEVEGVFGTGDRWTVPDQAWRRLGAAGLLYYRLVAYDQGGIGGCTFSVDDQHLGELPRLMVAAADGGPRCARPAAAPTARPRGLAGDRPA
ncbi:hypothetical protein [Pseudonocardia lacus]|uniref:hypothetical protein n=1 Tax=Pseudonocardia lacus TaxID=2835865 RepID=UPI001BDDAFD4|nr:hypothetical protein [Pseudonocardia lacus]